MGYIDLFTSHVNTFSDFQNSFNESDYVMLGIPFDVTSTYRTGARFGPQSIRQASLNLETYSFRTGIDIAELKVHDLGDLDLSSNVKKTMGRIEQVVQDIFRVNKAPVTIGGEHTITYGVISGFRETLSDTAIVSFDAHMDLREEFMDLKLSHTTFLRRVNEEMKPGKIMLVGTRAVCKEELEYAKKAEIEFFDSSHIRKDGVSATIKKMKRELANYKKVYISIDMDVLDPAYAPAVQNPEPEGLDTNCLVDLLGSICDNRVVGFDLVEVTPIYDNGITAIQASKIIFEVLCYLEKKRILAI